MEARTPLEDSVKRLIRYSIVLYVAVVVIAVGLGVVAAKVISESSDTNHALCTFRTDLEGRAESARKFLDENPKGFPGVSAESIRQSIKNQERTVTALRSLDC